MLSMLAVIDNPMQDIPLAAVLKSPFVGVTDQELAELMAFYRKCVEKGQDRGIFAAMSRFLEETENLDGEETKSSDETVIKSLDAGETRNPDGEETVNPSGKEEPEESCGSKNLAWKGRGNMLCGTASVPPHR